jgi:hypothetical protein
MIGFHVQVPTLKAPRFSRQDMLKIGQAAIQSVKQRVTRGLNLNDQRMKRLDPEYEKGKRSAGKQPIRNLWFSGQMLGAITPVQVTSNRVVIGFTRRSELIKARSNQKRQPFFGISRHNEEVIVAFASRLLKTSRS